MYRSDTINGSNGVASSKVRSNCLLTSDDSARPLLQLNCTQISNQWASSVSGFLVQVDLMTAKVIGSEQVIAKVFKLNGKTLQS